MYTPLERHGTHTHTAAARARTRALLAACLTCCGLTGVTPLAAAAAEPPAHGRLFIYPSQGQDQARLEDDRYQCHVWARAQSGFDPASVEATAGTSNGNEDRGQRAEPARNPAEGATATGAVAGAVLGAGVGARGHDALEGAVIGAAVGTLAGGTIEAEGARQAQRAAGEDAAQAAAAEAQRADYRRAIVACLEGRGYTVR